MFAARLKDPRIHGVCNYSYGETFRDYRVSQGLSLIFGLHQRIEVVLVNRNRGRVDFVCIRNLGYDSSGDGDIIDKSQIQSRKLKLALLTLVREIMTFDFMIEKVESKRREIHKLEYVWRNRGKIRKSQVK